MSYIKDLGSRAFGSRLKNLSDTLMHDVLKIYKEVHVDFEPRWFTIFQLLLAKKAVPITSIASELEQSHPAVIQVVNVLEKKKLIITTRDPKDQRKRLISLSKKGQELAVNLQDTWADIFNATEDLIEESDPEFLHHIGQFEKAIEKISLYNRVKTRISSRMINNLEFIPYGQQHKEIFVELKESWLKEYLEITSYDSKVLSNPVEEIISKKGSIYMAEYHGEIIGCFAIREVSTTACELLKFTVTNEYRGWGFGRQMLKHAIQQAMDENYVEMLLYTHEKLTEATGLYRDTGFQEIDEYPGFPEPTGRCSILMKLSLT